MGSTVNKKYYSVLKKEYNSDGSEGGCIEVGHTRTLQKALIFIESRGFTKLENGVFIDPKAIDTRHPIMEIKPFCLNLLLED